MRQLSASFDRYWNDARAYPVSALITEKELLHLQSLQEASTPATSATSAAERRIASLPPLNLQAIDWICAGAGRCTQQDSRTA